MVAGTKFWVRAIPRHQAVRPSKSPVLGIFFSCCGVIFAMTARYTARPEFSAGALCAHRRPDPHSTVGGAAIASFSCSTSSLSKTVSRPLVGGS